MTRCLAECRIKRSASGLWEFTILYGGTALHWGAYETEADAEDQAWLVMKDIKDQFTVLMGHLGKL